MKILIATDGSEYSHTAINFCRNLIPEPENTSIKILAAVEPLTPMAAEPFAVSAEYYNEFEKVGRQQAKEYLRQAETQIRTLFPDAKIDVSTELLSGSPQQAIVEGAKEWGADLIVLGSHGYGFWSRALLGSISNAVIHHAPCSVLVVRRTEHSNE